MAAQSHFTGEVFQDTYRLERVIGKGAMGVVYEASHQRLARHFAVKLLHGETASNPTALARFECEAKIASGIGHPNIVDVIDFNRTHEGTPYIVMELLEGEDLAARLARCGPLPLADAAEIVRQIASALHAAHQCGVVHRDLKPQNIVLCRRDNRDDFVKVVDFGISKTVGGGMALTQPDMMVGTPYYMAPEQAVDGAEVDARADVYALGVLLYEMLANEPPFRGDSIPKLLYKIVHDAPPPILARRPELPAALEAVVQRALAKNRDDRYPTMRALWRALAAVAGITADLSRSGAAEARAPDSDDGLGQTLPLQQSSRGTTTMPAGRGLRRAWVAGGLLALGVVGLAIWLMRAPAGSDPRGATPPNDRPSSSTQPARADYRARPADARRPPDAGGRLDAPASAPVSAASLSLTAVDVDGVVAATARLDGREVGQTPLLLRRLSPGPHQLTVMAEGYRPVTRRFKLSPGAHARLTVRLER